MTISNDKILKFEYDPVTNKWAFPVNDVGCVAPHLLAEYTGTPADASCVFVNTSTGNDSTGAGTQASPYKTIAHAISACDEDKTVVIVLNAATSSEDISGCTFTYFNGLYAASGVTHYLTFRVMGTTWTDDNCIFVDGETGDDDTGDGTQAAPYATIGKAMEGLTALKQEIEIMDSGTYIEEAYTIGANFAGIHGKLGEIPTVKININHDFISVANELSGYVDQGKNVRLTDACLLPNGNIFAVMHYIKGSETYVVYYAVFSGEDGSQIISKTSIASGYYSPSCTCSGNNILVTYIQQSSPYYSYYQILNSSTLEVITSQTLLLADISNYVKVHYLANGDILFARNKSNAPSAGTTYHRILNGETLGIKVSDVSRGSDISTRNIINLTSGNILAVECDDFSSYVIPASSSVVIYDPVDLSVVESVTLSELGMTGEMGAPPVVLQLANGTLLLSYSYLNSGTVYYLLLDKDTLEIIKTATAMPTPTSTSGIYTNYGPLVGIKTADGMLHYMTFTCDYARFDYHYDGLLLERNHAIDGIIFTLNENERVYSFIRGNYNLILQWMELNDIIADADEEPCVLADVAALTISNTRVWNCDTGLIAESANISIFESMFAVLNRGCALTITGAGSGIIIDHVDIFNCYGGLKLIDNNGSEVLKNSIIHDIDNYSVDAETAIDGDNCVITGISTGLDVSGSTRLFKANPLYINEGLLVPADIDLNIKIKLLGYPANSPAYLLADDGFNAGSHLVVYVGSETTWSSFTIIKPLEVPREIKPLNAVVNTKKSSAYKDGDTETITLNFATLTASEVEDLWKMLCCYRSGRYQYQVRLYPDPITCPNVYLLCCLDPVNSYVRRSTDLYLWDDDYAQDSKIVLTRRFEVEA